MTRDELIAKAKREKWNEKYVQRMVDSIEERRAQGLPTLAYEYILQPPTIINN